MKTCDYVNKLITELRTETDVNRIKRKILTLNSKIAVFPIGKEALKSIDEKKFKTLKNEVLLKEINKSKEDFLMCKKEISLLKEINKSKDEKFKSLKNETSLLLNQIEMARSQIKMAQKALDLIRPKVRSTSFVVPETSTVLENVVPKKIEKSKPLLALEKILEQKKARGRPKKVEEALQTV